MISTSTPKSSSSPRSSITRPRGCCVALGQSVISTSTTIPSRSFQSVWTAASSPITRSRELDWERARRSDLPDGAGGLPSACARGRGRDAPATAAEDGGDFDEDAVAVHGGSGGVRRNEDIAGEAGLETGIERSGFGNHEAEAVAMHGQAAYKQVTWHQVSGPRS